MAPLPEHLQGDGLFLDADGKPPAPEPETPTQDKPAEAPPEKKPEPPPEKPDEDDDDTEDDEFLSADDLERMIDEKLSAKAAKQDEGDELDDLLADPRDKEIKTLRAQLEVAKAAEMKQAEDAEMDRAEHEMKSCVGKWKMTDAERDATIRWFEMNPDLEGHPDWTFERAALRVNPDLRGRITSPQEHAEKNGEGSAPNGSARVINRGAAGGDSPAPPKFKAARGSYSDVSAHLMRSGAASRFFTRERG